jgi:hypothetical protein
MDSEIWAVILAAVFGGGGIFALLKIRPEAGQISVSAAQGAVIVQTGVIDTLRSELGRTTNELAKVEGRLAQLEEDHMRCQERLRELERRYQAE